MKVKYLIASLILVLLLTLGSGCNLLPAPTTAPPSAPSPAIPTATGNITRPADKGVTIPVAENPSPPLPSIADVVAKVKPSVVAINTELTSLDIFNRPLTQQGAGSGWIIRADGYIVTNNHVIEGANNVNVTLDDGRSFPVDVKTIATDTLADLAILKINATGLPALNVGDSTKLRVGDWVVAIGNSLGRGTRATVGIVSQLGVSLQVDQGQTLYNLLETSAAINPGNSGGPLVNMAGQAIGITSAKIASIGVEATGYAISSQEAMPIIQQLVNTGYTTRPWLGVGLYTVDQFVVQRYNLAVDTGALILNVAIGSPANKAGLQAGDVITEFEGQEITEVDKLIRAIHTARVGQEVKITFWRGKTKNSTTATLTESPPPPK
ncbi:MAG: trypsin-like peptidase domain-containing protein [Chloroflexi bacterium]|nr:trypsin-like peptidase domain-containing protein [Chloroflexota bacterium]